jgi:hypothetical protein
MAPPAFKALGFLVHLLEVYQPRRPHVLDRIDIDVDHRAAARGQRALQRRLEFGRIGNPLAVGAHALAQLVELDLAEVGLDRLVGIEVLEDHGLDRPQHELLVHLDHAPLLVGEHDVDHLRLVAHRGFDFLRMEAHGAVADDAADRLARPRQRGGHGLRGAGAEHAELEGRDHRVGHRDLVVEHGPDRRVAAVGDQHRVRGEEFAADGADVGRMHRHRHVGERLVPAGAVFLHGLGVAGDAGAAGIEPDLGLARLEFRRQSSSRKRLASATTPRSAGLLRPMMSASMSTCMVFCSEGGASRAACPTSRSRRCASRGSAPRRRRCAPCG